MKNNHGAAIFGFILLMFVAAAGSYAEELAQQGISHDLISAKSFWLAIVDMVLLTLLMMVVPFICRLINKKALSYKRGKRLCLWNSILIFLIMNIITISTKGVASIGGIGALFFYFINKWTFVDTKPTSTTKNVISSAPPIDKQTIQSPLPKAINTEQSSVKLNAIYQTSVTTFSKYCSRCGKGIDPNTKKCTGCGKQYFKGISFKTFLVITLCIILFLSLAINIFLCFIIADLRENSDILTKETSSLRMDKSQLKSEKKQLNSTINNLNSTISKYETEIDFYNKYVVLVANNDTDLYHHYNCHTFQSSDSFWVYSINEAVDKGFNPCPDCIN